MLQLENYMRWLPRNRMFQGGGGQGAVINFGLSRLEVVPVDLLPRHPD